MIAKLRYITLFLVLLLPLPAVAQDADDESPVTGAERTSLYLPLLQGKNVGLVGNQASMVYHDNNDDIAPCHLLDLLLSKGVNVVRLFSPEHGFRMQSEAGAAVNDTVDVATGILVVSLYGNNRKPTLRQLKGVDIVLFDLQDMGVRFFTYISTLHYVMEACAEAGIPLVVLDRYNPHTSYVDGPVLEDSCRSFVGIHPVPVCYGMTIGEYALMINGEGWLRTDSVAGVLLTVIPMQGFRHEMVLTPRVAPSPNLQTRQAMLLYPSLCLFEGTNVSVGRGTDHPFEVVGAPTYKHHKGIARLFKHDFSFVPHPVPGVSNNPPFNGKQCYGLDLQNVRPRHELDLDYLLQMWQGMPHSSFFLRNGYFNLLAGNRTLQRQLEQGLSEREIRASWQTGLETFRQTRAKYLLYE